jgi:hypothetical protein
VPEAVRIAQRHSGRPAMISEQGAQSCKRHPGAACRSLQGYKQCT